MPATPLRAQLQLPAVVRDHVHAHETKWETVHSGTENLAGCRTFPVSSRFSNQIMEEIYYCRLPDPRGVLWHFDSTLGGCELFYTLWLYTETCGWQRQKSDLVHV